MIVEVTDSAGYPLLRLDVWTLMWLYFMDHQFSSDFTTCRVFIDGSEVERPVFPEDEYTEG